jgi:endonuclease III
MLFASTHPVFPADAHLTRVALRLGYGTHHPNLRKQIRSVRRALNAHVSADLERRRHTVLYLSHHGHTTCIEHDPHCHVCPLLDGCPYGLARKHGS